jgi:hypothetical protein
VAPLLPAHPPETPARLALATLYSAYITRPVERKRGAMALQGRPLRIMFADEARFGRMNRPRPCWAPKGVRPEVPCQLIREFTYLYGAVCPKDGTCVFLILPSADTECFQIFLDTLGKKYPRSHFLLFVDGAGNHISGDLVIPSNITLSPLPAYSPELNPQSIPFPTAVLTAS